MRFVKIILCALLLQAAMLPAAAEHPPSPMRFPTVTAYNLNKAKVTLPTAFAGQRNLLLLSFSAGQTPEINRWVAEAQSLHRLDDSLSYYLLPISGRKNPLYRWWDNSAMRSDFTDPQLWPSVVPLYVNESRFRKELQIPSSRHIVILLTDRSGKVLWRTSGRFTAKKRAELRAQIHA